MSSDAILRHKARHYPNLNEVIKQVNKVQRQYKELRLDVQFFTHNDGKQENLVTLDGTIPVFYKNRQYNIPIMIWLYEKHPEYAPMVFVKPTSTMVIRQGRHVDTSGKVYLPYLSEWKSRRSDLIGLVGVLCTVFGSEPPVVSKPAGAPARPVQPPVRSATSSYPTQPTYPSQPPPFPGTSPHASGHAQMHVPSHGGHAPYHAPYPQNTPQGPPSMGYRPPMNQSNLPYPTAAGFPSHPPSGANPPPYPTGGYPPSSNYQVKSQPAYGNTIDDTVILASVRDSVNDSLKRRAQDIISQLNGELNTLRVTENELTVGARKIAEMSATVEDETAKCAHAIDAYRAQLAEMDAEIENLQDGNKINPEEIITPSTPIYKQIFHAHAQEQAIEDAIYFISKALSRGTIDCETYLRYVRRLSRKQFEMKETVIRAREAARL